MDNSMGTDLAAVEQVARSRDAFNWVWEWTCEKWEQDKIDHVIARMIRRHDESEIRIDHGDIKICHNVSGMDVWRPVEDGLPSDLIRAWGLEADDVLFVHGNLLLNEGIQRLMDMTMIATVTSNQVSTNPWSNANSFLGVGDSTTAEAASQTDLQASTNKFYKGMLATYPIRTSQSCDFRSDFTTSEANYAWQEWSVAAGATSASGSGFTVGTTNLNRKVQSLGTKTTGTWTLTGTVTIS